MASPREAARGGRRKQKAGRQWWQLHRLLLWLPREVPLHEGAPCLTLAAGHGAEVQGASALAEHRRRLAPEGRVSRADLCTPASWP